jgi:hypothetical protein
MIRTIKKISQFLAILFIFILISCSGGGPALSSINDSSSAKILGDLSFAEVRSIAKEAYIYGFPIVDNSRVQYDYFVNTDGPDFKAPWNVLFNIPHVFTPKDTVIQTPNSDTPYSWIGLDLRAEPMVFTVPPIAKNRYWCIQFIDLYTFNIDYCGSRTTGNGGGNFMIVGPDWKGETPKAITKVIRCETEIASAQYRTQLFNPSDLKNVIKIQKQYIVKPLSAFLGQPAPAPAPKINFIKPLSRETERTSIQFFNNLNAALRFCPTVPSEIDLRAQLAKIGIEGGKDFDTAKLSIEVKNAMREGIKDAWTDFAGLMIKLEKGEVSSADGFGTREFMKNNYLFRMGGAVVGIFGNSKQEALYPTYFTDGDGNKLMGSNHYTMHFPPNQFPPVESFWSITMYDQPASLLIANPLDRYLLNSPMTPQFKKDPDGGVTLYFQHDSPGKDKESNWLPAPAGLFSLVMRLYWPKEPALNGTWKKTPLIKVMG